MLFKDEFLFSNPFNIVFLCGSKYLPQSGKDKRVLLKGFLKEHMDNCQIVLLEENFSFAKNTKTYLAYDSIFVKDLSQVESLAALYADRIIVIHETLSTAAEIGMFASNRNMLSKIGILVPDDISIEEKKLSSFIKLAFLNNRIPKSSRPTVITYYPDVEVHRNSKNKSDYYSYFHNNTIGENLGKRILDFVDINNKKTDIRFKKQYYNKPCSSNQIVSYFFSKEDNNFEVFVSPEILKLQLFSMFFNKSFRSEFRKNKPIKEHVTYIEKNYKELLLNTVCTIEGKNEEICTVAVSLNGSSCDIRQSIGYFLYMLQATELIVLEQKNEECDNRKIRITELLDKYASVFSDYIYEEKATAFGDMINE